jgi:uncharacterized coiled-coil protein SlyX
MKTPKKRNPQDATLRNTRAADKRLDALEAKQAEKQAEQDARIASLETGLAAVVAKLG